MKNLTILFLLLFSISSCKSVSNSTQSDYVKPVLTDKQREIISNSTDLIWKENGLRWKIPQNSTKRLERPNMLTYGLPNGGSMFVSITPAPTIEEAESINKKHYLTAMENEKSGLVERVKLVEIAEIKGVEFVEKVPTKEGLKRFMWLAYREFNNKPQFIQVVCGAKESDFENVKDVCVTFLYSMEQFKN